MNAQQLKNSILQLAVQGKLVPQNPNDEPASELVKRIRAEKDKLIKEKKIKPDKNPSYIFRGSDNLPYEKVGKNEPVCIADEIPFDIPDCWEWVRLKTICQINPRNIADDNLLAGFMPMPLLQAGYKNKHSYESKKWGKIKKGFTHFMDNDIVIAKITPCFQNRKSAIIKNLPNKIGAGTTELHVVRDFSKNLYLEYLLVIFKTEAFISNGVKAFSGTAGQQRVGKNYIEEYLIPLPPFAEQQRIVDKIKELEPYIKEYDKSYEKLEKLNKDFPEMLKKSVLQEAVQGKLVPQNPDDEPASVLIEKIRQEKAQLIKDKKIKKNKNESYIFKRDNSHYEKLGNNEPVCIDDELPFDIPDSWEWVRLGSISNYGICINIESKDISKGMWILDLEDIEKNTGKLLIKKTEQNIKRLSTKHKFFKQQILYSKLRPYLNKVIIADEDGCCTSEILPITFYGNIYPKYAQLFMMSPYFVSYANHCSYGVKMPRLGTEDGKNAFFALPPLAEQKRIVDKVKSVMDFIEKL